jgi:class 3 adenylate cyclase
VRTIEKLLYSLFPGLLLKSTPWEALWNEQEKRQFVTTARIFFVVTFFGYVLHYFTVDRFEGLAPSPLWFRYRFGMALTSLVCLGLYSFQPFVRRFKYYRLPTILATILFCYFQTRTVIWYPKVPYLYSFAFVVVSALILRSNILRSASISTFTLALIWPTLIESGQSSAMVFSGSFFSVACVVLLRMNYLADLNFFILSQKSIEQQKRIIEINMEFTNQIKAFLPDQISKRMTVAITKQRLNVIEAVDEILRPRKLDVACLFSDIRNFTKSANDLDGFVSRSMVPNVREATQAVEEFAGIPRKVGDLLFAYFDDTNKQINLANALSAAARINRINEELNAGLEERLRIKRYILISSGQAFVGNLSGYQSAIEITAIGRPVNLLSRIDELTKTPALNGFLQAGSIIMDPETMSCLSEWFEELRFEKIDLKRLDVRIRSFEDIDSLYLFPIDDQNLLALERARLSYVTRKAS